MIPTKFKRLVSVRDKNGDGGTGRRIWVTDTDEAALVDPDAGRLFAYVWHDGYGKYHPRLAVSALQAVRLVSREAAQLLSLRSFPRVTVELFRIKADGLPEAQRQIEAVLGDLV